MKPRKFLGLCAALAVFLLPMAPPVSAAWPTNGDCDHLTVGNFYGGAFVKEEATVAKTAVSANLYMDTARFQPCTNPLGSELGGTLQWVALQSTIPESYPYDIAQVGVIKCSNVDYGQYADSACTSARVGHLVYFYAFGWNHHNECNSSSHAPRPIYLGDAATPVQYVNFQVIWDRAGGRIRFYINGVLLRDISDLNFCWLISQPYPAIGTFYAERWDPNDGFGPNPVHFDNTRYATGGASVPTWKTAAITSGNVTLDPEFVATYYATDHFGIETIQR